MDSERKAILLDYAQELQTNDQPWEQFEYCCVHHSFNWLPMEPHSMDTMLDPYLTFRRKSSTITITIPIPWTEISVHGNSLSMLLGFLSQTDRDAAITAIREAKEMGKP